MNHTHEPTDQLRKLVESSSGLGLPHEQIAILVGIDDKTLRKHYRQELDIGKAKANSQIAKTLYQKATAGDTTSLIWWTKAQMGWGETNTTRLANADGSNIDGFEIILTEPDGTRSKA